MDNERIELFGSILQLDKNNIKKTELYLEELNKESYNLIEEFLETKDEVLQDLAKFVMDKMMGVTEYLIIVFGIKPYKDENGKIKLMSIEEDT